MVQHRRFLISCLLFLSFLSIQAGIKPRGFTRNATRAGMVIDHDNNRTPMTIGRRSDAPLQCTGMPLVPVVLVQFADTTFICADTDSAVNEFYDKFLNGEVGKDYYTGAGSYGAVSEYFRDQSYGQFMPVFVPLGPVTLSKSYSYYGQNSGSSKDIHINEFFSEAIKLAQNQISNNDWEYFDNNGDGMVDMVFFIYAGRGENDSQSRNPDLIWPKENGNGGTIGGVKYGAYACCNEVYAGQTDGIGVMCHELSHALGLPDFYDTNYQAYGLDFWDVMDSGNYCANGYRPCGYSAYEKAFMGWRELIPLEAGVGQDLTLYPMTRENGYAYKITNPENKNEYYIIENRYNEGWDYNIGYSTSQLGLFHGLLVTHIDYKESRWTGNSVNTDASHQLCTLIPADGLLSSSMYVGEDYTIQDYVKFMGGDIFPGTAYVSSDSTKIFEPIDSLTGEKAYVYTSTGSTPHQMNQPITNIVLNNDGSLTLSFCGGDPVDISNTTYTSKDSEMYYDIQGRAHSAKSTLASGIYIYKGRKIVIH